MVQLVFVHGVATRTNESYETEVANRDRLFRDILFEGRPIAIRAPRWGDLVPPINNDVFSGTDSLVAYGGLEASGGMGMGLGAAGGGDGFARDVSKLADDQPVVALDAVYATLVEQADADGRLLSDSDMAAFKAATRSIEDGGTGFPSTASDDELVMFLEDAAPGSYGINSTIKAAVTAVADRIRNETSALVFNSVRDIISPMVGRFLGDVFVYLKSGDLREEIRARVRGEILSAATAARLAGEPLVLIGHSLGGVILYDLLSSPGSAGLPADLDVAALLTVGSQTGLFESMGLFEAGSAGPGLRPGPACVRNWHNILDPIDPLGFRAEPLFEKVEDFAFDSVTGLISAHTTYFKRPQFHARTRARLRALGLV